MVVLRLVAKHSPFNSIAHIRNCEWNKTEEMEINII